jgi:peptide/nickel transport system substrate-binding protein
VVGRTTPKYGGIIPMSIPGTPPNIDLHRAITTEAQGISSPMYNQIIQYDPINPSVIIGDLAESWELSDDGLAYTFRIRKDVKWWDGEDLDADDVVFSLNRMVQEGEPRGAVAKIKQYIDRVEVVDKYTVTAHMKFPSGAFLKFIATDFFKVVPQHVVQAGGVDINIFENVVGSGPFMGVKYTLGDSWEMEKNPNYFKEARPFFDGFKVFIIVDKGTDIAALRTERVLMHVLMSNNLDVEDFVRLEKDEGFMSKFDIWGPVLGGVNHIMFNTTRPPFDNENVRRALFLALDRQELVDGFGLGKYFLGGVMGPSNPHAIPVEELVQMPGFRQLDGKSHPDDIAEANRLLADAGYGPDNPLKVDLMTPVLQFWADATVVIKEQFESTLGAEVSLTNLDLGGTFGRVLAKDFDMVMFGAGLVLADPDDIFADLYLDVPRNFTGWKDDRVEELFKQQQQELDFEKRKAINREMQLIVLNSGPPYLNYLWIAFSTVVSKRISTEKGRYVQSDNFYSNRKHEHEWLEPK